MTPNDALVNIIKTGSTFQPELHNKLMRITDREIALSMMYMQEVDRRMLLSLLSAEKANRILDELKLHTRLRIRYPQYRIAIDHVIQILNDEKKSYALKSYLKPHP